VVVVTDEQTKGGRNLVLMGILREGSRFYRLWLRFQSMVAALIEAVEMY
jgi:hypothetical protein